MIISACILVFLSPGQIQTGQTSGVGFTEPNPWVERTCQLVNAVAGKGLLDGLEIQKMSDGKYSIRRCVIIDHRLRSRSLAAATLVGKDWQLDLKPNTESTADKENEETAAGFACCALKTFGNLGDYIRVTVHPDPYSPVVGLVQPAQWQERVVAEIAIFGPDEGPGIGWTLVYEHGKLVMRTGDCTGTRQSEFLP